ncbi:MAG TPA: DNA-binding response regulator [Lactobacillus sp.]|nr:DNA-binding response regulator [Lactobacillus sp.]
MIDIFVCEDNYKQLNEIVNYINKYLLIENFDMEIKLAATDPHEILNYLGKNEVRKSLFFLDIALETDINGIELASEIRKKDIDSKIVFITTHSEMVFLTFKYQVEALDFILKDFPDEIQSRVTAAIDLCNKQFQKSESQSEEYYQIKTREHLRSVRVKDILFFESSTVPHKIIVHLINGQFEFYSTVKEIENENKNFYRCHKSYVVNVKNIKSINRHTKEITMIDGEKVLSSVLACRALIKMI